jgi:hypothetical protein
MKTKKFLMCMVMASIIPFNSIVVANDDTPKDDNMIVLTNDSNHGSDGKRSIIPITATICNQVLCVQFLEYMPVATVTVQNVQTGSTVHYESISATPETACYISLSELTWGTYILSVTNELNGQSVSGEFSIK